MREDKRCGDIHKEVLTHRHQDEDYIDKDTDLNTEHIFVPFFIKFKQIQH